MFHTKYLKQPPLYGGRIKKSNNFADFPIPLGGEWIHTSADVLTQIVNDSTVSVDIETVGYPNDASLGWWSNGELEITELGKYEDLKFVNSSWLDFFEGYILPSVTDKISYNTVVDSIDYSGDQVSVVEQIRKRIQSP